MMVSPATVEPTQAEDFHADPTITVLPGKFAPSWPAKADKPPARASRLALSDALVADFATDAHFQVCSVVGPMETHYRLNNDALAVGAVAMRLLVVDVDGHGLAEGDRAAWWLADLAKVETLLSVHPGAFLYRTRGGYRLVWVLPKPIVLRTREDGERWRTFYERCVLYLARRFGIVGDITCSDWTRLYRLPHVTRDRKSGPERLDTLGDPKVIGAWSHLPSDADLADDVSTAEQLRQELAEQNPTAKGNPFGAVIRRLRASCEGSVGATRPATGAVTRIPSRSPRGSDVAMSGTSRRGLVALEDECQQLASMPRGSGRNAALNKAAYKLGRLVGADELPRHMVESELESACRANGLTADDGLASVRRTIRSGLGRGLGERPLEPLRGEGTRTMPSAQTADDYTHVHEAASSQESDTEGEPESQDDAWRDQLVTRRVRGGEQIVPCLQSVVAILGSSPEWRGVIVYDRFRLRPIKLGSPPWDPADAPDAPLETPDWRDEDDISAALYLSRRFGLRVSSRMVSEAVRAVARTHAFHPVCAYLDSLEWDGTPRLSRWLSTYMGADDTDYHRLVGRWWLISAVARVYEPGCKVDTLPVFEGKQGKRKSSGVRALVPDPTWFFDSGIDLSSKDAYQALRGRWFVEFAELEALGKADAAAVKRFVSSPIDSYRPSYGRTEIEVPRQCVFAGTVNDSQYFRDTTGNRRFWPVRCDREIDVEGIARDRDQLWAEARNAFRAGEHWWPEDTEHRQLCEDQQEERLEADAWEGMIAEWMETPIVRMKSEITLADVLKDALGFRSQDGGAKPWSPTDQKRAARALARLGWARVRRDSPDRNGYRPWLYCRIGGEQ